MNKGLLAVISFITIAFVSMNLFLLLKSESPISRTVVIDKMKDVTLSDLQITLDSLGIVVPEEEQLYTVKDNGGELKGFLVDEGDEVFEGTALLELRDSKLEQDIKQVELKLARIAVQQDNVEDEMAVLKRQDAVEVFYNQEGDEIFRETNSYQFALQDKQSLLNLLKAEEEESEQLLEYYQDKQDELVIESKIAGRVREIDHSAEGPKVTIVSTPYQVKGTVSEMDLTRLESGQKVMITSNALPDAEFEGIISHISSFPTEEVTKGEVSTYPFVITLNEGTERDEELIYGFHVDLSVVVEESLDTVVVPVETIVKKGRHDKVFVVADGRVEEREVELGLKNGDQQEVVSGLDKGELIVRTPSRFRKNKELVVTPIKKKYIAKETFQQLSRNEIIKEGLRGFLN